MVLPHIDYCLTVYGHTNTGNILRVQQFQNRAARICTQNFDFEVPSVNLIRQLGWQTVSERLFYLTSVLMFKCLNGVAPNYLADNLTYMRDVHSVTTRQVENDDLYIPWARTNYMQNSFQVYGPSVWNRLPQDVRELHSVIQF